MDKLERTNNDNNKNGSSYQSVKQCCCACCSDHTFYVRTARHAWFWYTGIWLHTRLHTTSSSQLHGRWTAHMTEGGDRLSIFSSTWLADTPSLSECSTASPSPQHHRTTAIADAFSTNCWCKPQTHSPSTHRPRRWYYCPSRRTIAVPLVGPIDRTRLSADPNDSSNPGQTGSDKKKAAHVYNNGGASHATEAAATETATTSWGARESTAASDHYIAQGWYPLARKGLLDYCGPDSHTITPPLTGCSGPARTQSHSKPPHRRFAHDAYVQTTRCYRQLCINTHKHGFRFHFRA